MARYFRVLCFALFCLMLRLPLGAQVSTANVSGLALDPSGAAIPGATVVLVNTASSVKRTAVTDAQGRFTFAFVQVGAYKLQASATGFVALTSPEFSLAAGQQAEIPVHFSLQSATENVEVSAEEMSLDTTQATVISQVTNAQLNDLPVQHQDWSSLLTITAGAIKPPTATSTLVPSTPGGVSINGLPSVGYNLTVDGTNASTNTEFTSYAAYQQPNIINTINNDAIQGVEVSKGVIPATVADAVSGNINLTTRSGGNDLHGSLYEINEESLYDARNGLLTARPRTTFNEYGGFVSGPIYRPHLFFFGSYEGARLRTARVVSGNVPTPYLDSIAPSIYQPLLSLFPSIAQPASATATAGLYTGPGTFAQNDGNGVARIDYNINPSNQIFVRYIRARPYQLLPNIVSTNPQVTISHSDEINSTYTHAGKRWAENSRFGYNRNVYDRVQEGYYSQLPNMTFGWTTTGANAFLSHGYYLTGEQSIAGTIGNHNLQFGGIVQKTNSSRYKLSDASITYSTLAQFLADKPNTVSLMLYQNPQGAPDLGYTKYWFGGYAQDDWHLLPSLTLNLGVRYDYFTVPQEYLGRVFNRGVDPNNPQLGAGFGPYRPANSMYNADRNNVQPRVGFAWSPSTSAGTVVRGGFGVLVADNTLFAGPVGVENFSSQLPFAVNLNSSQTAASGLAYPINNTLYPQTLASLEAAGIISVNLVNITIPANHPDPYSMQWTFGVEQQMPHEIKFELDYIGNHALKLDQYILENQPDRVTGVAPVPTFSTFYSFANGDRSMYNGLQASVTKNARSFGIQAVYAWGKVLSYGDADLLQQLPPQDDNNLKAEYGPSPYDLRNRFVANARYEFPIARWAHWSNGFAHRVADGWQISGVFSAQSGSAINIVNTTTSLRPADRPDRQPGPAYLTNYRRVNALGAHQYLNNCIGSATLPTVTPTTSPCSLNPVTPGFSLVATGADSQQIRGGDLMRYGLVGPPYQDLDASFAKTTAITERVNFQLRLDAFDVLNHQNFGAIVTTINTPATFGEASSTTNRTVQIGGRISF